MLNLLGLQNREKEITEVAKKGNDETACDGSPFLTPSLIMRVAIGACPCPRERAWKRWPMPDVSASCRRAAVGSTPGDSTKISGVLGVESSTT